MAIKEVNDPKDPNVDPLREFRSARKVATPCTVGIALTKMTDEQREKLNAAFASHDIQTTAIMRVVDSWGYPFGPGTLQRHRRGDCACLP